MPKSSAEDRHDRFWTLYALAFYKKGLAMRTLVTFVVSAFLTLLPSAGRADGLLYQLPEDGTSAIFDMKLEMEFNGKHRNATGTFAMSSVGTAEVGDEPCRWIEFKMVMVEENGREDTNRGKVLIPEQHLGKGKSPLEHVKKAWIKLGEGMTQELDDFTGRKAGPIPAFLPPPLDDIAALEPMTVESGLGPLECAGLTGETAYKQDSGDHHIAYRTRLHDKAPFGVVATKMQVTYSREGRAARQVTMTLVLRKVEEGKTSELPDHND